MVTALGYYTRKMTELRHSRGGRCERCGSTECLEWAHVIPNRELGTFPHCRVNGKRLGRGMPQRYHDIKRNPENYRLLCHACHVIEDTLGTEPPF